ncbi:hypothetical protein [Natronorubrum sp. FCH18a]|uniref:hypothetical protein n=1 Tax=Natronorubrum sp. FCH18a TaxID=3447018 RepID=UPI003F50E2FC
MGRDRRRDRNPGRQTRPANSATRRTWYGLGKLSRAKKSGFGRALHDCSHVFGDISILALPTLFAIMAAPGPGIYDATAAGLLAWTTMVAVGTAIRGGWIRPLATDTLGWVAVTPSLLVLRFVYYNLALSLAVFGGVWLADVLDVAPLSLGVAFVVSVVSILAFPRLAESVYGRLRER